MRMKICDGIGVNNYDRFPTRLHDGIDVHNKNIGFATSY